MTKKKYVLSCFLMLLFFLGVTQTYSQKKITFVQKMKNKKKLSEGKTKLYGGDNRGALYLYKSVLSVDTANAVANAGTAECYLNLGRPKLGKKYALKALRLDPKVDEVIYFVLAESYHRLGDLKKAKENYLIFKSKASNRLSIDFQIDRRIKQCEYAEKMMNSPVDITITNMGKNINTFSPEYAASVSSDGKILVFTSRRADTDGGKVDVNSDNLYFEDIYISFWSDSLQEWSESEPVSGNVNTVSHDAVLSISPDGNSLLVYRNEIGETKSGDIYLSRRGEENTFGSAKPIDEGRRINSNFFESSASFTQDGNEIYFVSDRPRGKGAADIYMSRRQDGGWSKPLNLGDSINTTGDENCVFIHPNGNFMFFTSNGQDDCLGSYDIYMSKKVNGAWTKAVNLGYPINTVGDEKTISVTVDGKTGYISANYKDSKGKSDIYKVDLSRLNLLK